MPRPRRNQEKPQNFGGTWKKLFRYLNRYHAAMICALFCAAAGVLCTLNSPGLLSDLTNAVADGITPRQEIVKEISDTMKHNLETNSEALSRQLAANITTAWKPQNIELNGQIITPEEQQEAAKTLSENTDINALPASVQKALLPDIRLEGETITTQDQLDMMHLFSSLDTDDQEAVLSALDSLPPSVYRLTEPHINMDKVTEFGLKVLALTAAAWILSLLQGWIMAGITQKTSYRMREEISVKVNRLPISYFEKTTIGDVLSRITNDVDTISQSLNQSISTLLTSILMLAGSLYLMITTNVTMTLTAVAASLLGFLLMFAVMGRSQKYFNRMQNSLGKLNGHIEEIYAGHTVVKAYNDEEKALRQFEQYNGDMVRSAFKATAMASIMQPMMAFIGNFGYVAICVAGGAMALNGTITFGTIVAFIMYVRYFTQPLSQIAQAFSSMQSAAAAGERVFGFLEETEMSDESHKTARIENTNGQVDFSHVRFRYPGADHDVIHDFSARATHGQKIAIVGPTGAGKTTLVNLLMRFYEVEGGAISIDGIPTTDLTRSDVHSQFCMVLQDTWLFEGTLRDNLAYNTKGLSDEDIMKACKAVGLDHLVKTLPERLDTLLNDQVSLSVGQKQQVTIARAMLANHPMLILDEATSSLDTRTEQQIQKAMDKLMEKRTSFVIAHRLSTIKDADLILVMNHGDIVETGTHQQLLDKNGFYASLYNAQFDDNPQPA